MTKATEAPRGESSAERACLRVVLVASLVLHALIALPLFEGKVYTYDDLSRYHLPMRQFYAACLRNGWDPSWNPDLYCGFFLQGEGQIGMDHPYHWLLYRALPLHVAFMLEVVLSYPFLQAGAYLMLRRWPLGRAPAAVGSLLLAFSAPLVLRLVHVNAIAALAHMPWLLWASDRLLRGGTGRLAGPLLVLLTISQYLLGHPQFAYYSALMEVWYVAVLLFAGGRWRRVPTWLVAKALGALGAAIQLVPTVHELGNSVRSEVTIGFGITRPEHAWNLVQWIAPYVYRARTYFPEVPAELGQYTHEGTLYLGALAPVLLAWMAANLGAAGGARALARGAAILAAIALPLTFIEATPLLPLYRRIPIVRLFRVSARYYLLVQVAVAILSAITVSALLRADRSRRSIVWPVAIPPLLASLVAIGLWAHGLSGAPEQARLLADPLLALAGPALSLAAALVVAACARGRRWAPVALVLLTAADLGAYGLTFLRAFQIQTMAELIASLPRMPGENPGTRIHMIGWPIDRTTDVMVLAGHRLVGGYAALMPTRSLDFDVTAAARVAGVGWLLDRRADGARPPRWTPSPDPLPRARLVTRAVVSRDPAADLASIDPAEAALVDEPLDLPPGRPGEARIERDEPGTARIVTQAPTRQLLVFSERYHDGWHAAVDGRPRPVVRCYGDFLGVVVDAGRHVASFRFEPWSTDLGRWVSWGAWAILAAWSALAGMAGRFQATLRPEGAGIE